MSNAEDGCTPSFCMEELVWEAFVNYLEYGLGVALLVALGSHRTALTCQKNVYIYWQYTHTHTHTHTKLTYLDHPNKNIDHPDLKVIRILVQ